MAPRSPEAFAVFRSVAAWSIAASAAAWSAGGAAVVVGVVAGVVELPVRGIPDTSPGSAGVCTGVLDAALASACLSVLPTPTRPAYQTSTLFSCGYDDEDDDCPWM